MCERAAVEARGIRFEVSSLVRPLFVGAHGVRPTGLFQHPSCPGLPWLAEAVGPIAFAACQRRECASRARARSSRPRLQYPQAWARCSTPTAGLGAAPTGESAER